MRNVFLASCVLAGAVFASDTPSTAPKTAPKAAPVAAAPAKVAALEHIAVIGASISAGFGLDDSKESFAESTIQLSNIIDASLNVAHQPTVSAATMLFFMNPQQCSTQSMALIAKEKPTLVVGLDYLFWFGYGSGKDLKEETRIARVDAALKELEPLTCTILLGDLPDMTLATKASEPMLQANQVPQPDTLKKINANITAWCAAHKNVVLVPLADLTAKVQSDSEVTVRGNTWPKGSIAKLMQKDRLHTTLEGTCAVWALAADCLMKAHKDVPETSFELDVAKLMPKVGPAKAAPKKNAEPTPPAGKDAKAKAKSGAGHTPPK
jgi:hypothetical protein